MKRPDGHPDFPVWKLERYLLGELPGAEMERINGLKERDPDLAGWIEAVRAEHRDLAEMHPTGRVAGRIWNRLRQDGNKRLQEGALRFPWVATRTWAPVLGVLLVLFLFPFNHFGWLKPQPTTAEGPESTRLKGLQPALFLYRKAGESAEGLKTGDRVRPGELVQIYYDAAERGYGAIFSVDGEGKVTWHLPDGGNRSASLAGGRKVPLDFAFELDSLAGFERFYFIASDRPFLLDSALSGLAREKAEQAEQAEEPREASHGPVAAPESLPLPEGLFQKSILLLKESKT